MSGSSSDTLYAYDRAGNQNSVTDPLGDATVTTYDSLNRVQSVSLNGSVTQNDYYDNSNTGGSTTVGGDSGLTQVIRYPFYNQPDQITTNYYNWQDQLAATSNVCVRRTTGGAGAGANRLWKQ